MPGTENNNLKLKEKNKGGRPLLFKDEAELQVKIDEYINVCKENQIDFITKEGKVIKISKPLIPTIAGLAYHLGTDRHTIYNYEEKDEYFHTIKKIRNYILSQIETKLVNTDGNTAGTIFISKNYGYTDRQEIEHKFNDIDEILLKRKKTND